MSEIFYTPEIDPRRFGPRVSIAYSCHGCVHHCCTADGSHFCSEPYTVGQYGEPQRTCSQDASTPQWCRYLLNDQRAAPAKGV